MRKIWVISIILSSVALAQNDGLVKTNYPSGALQTEGNYTNGVRDGLWTFWYEAKYIKITEKTMNPTPRTRVKATVFGTL